MALVGAEMAGRFEDTSAARQSRASVRAWLYVLAALVVVMVAVGGATRLTGSGLSITEWKPVTGAVPPLSETAWAAEFDKYRASSQYQNLNRGMALSEFKAIYWWEWSHRQLGRAIGLIFLLPLAFFWWRGDLDRRKAAALLGVGLLGGLQATVGWIMVASGLEPGMTAVAPIKLTLHLVLASAILASLVWMATGMGAERSLRTLAPAEGTDATAKIATTLLVLVMVQIALGGLVAGSKAGWTYNTWPLMDGRLVPATEALFAVRPWIENFVDNPALVQFQHRGVAYLVVGLAIWQAVRLRRERAGAGQAGHRATAIALLALAQMALGILTLLLAVPLWAGLAHQLLAMGLLAAATVHARLSLTEGRGAGQRPGPLEAASALPRADGRR